MELECEKVDEMFKVANEATARRFVLPLNVDNAMEGKNLVKIENCTATASIRKTSDTKPTVHLEAQHFTNDWMELPRINYQYNAKKYNYFYGLSSFNKKAWTSFQPDAVNDFINENILTF